MLEHQIFVILVRCLDRNVVLNGKSRIFTMDARLFSCFCLDRNAALHGKSRIWRWMHACYGNATLAAEIVPRPQSGAFHGHNCGNKYRTYGTGNERTLKVVILAFSRLVNDYFLCLFDGLKISIHRIHVIFMCMTYTFFTLFSVFQMKPSI